MTDIQEVADLLVLHGRKLRELADLVEQFGDSAYGKVPIIRYEQAIASAQRSRTSSERIQRIYRSLAPYLRENIAQLDQDAGTLRQMLRGLHIQFSEVS